MTALSDITAWMTLAHLPGWSIARINRLIIQIVHEEQITVTDFFALDAAEWLSRFQCSARETANLEQARNDMPRLAFIAEQLLHEGYRVIPLNAPEYPAALKENLKINGAPPVLYVKGKISLLQEEAVAIVGSRKAGPAALEFTDYIARKCAGEHKIVVSGYAKGVDRQALDTTLAAGGRSIIVLPQGILTFQSGFSTYYQAIVQGNVLVLSTFFPKAGWEVGLAMARNAYIYGLAGEIYVAESDSKGGTWEGVLDGLKRGRKVYMRKPGAKERNANDKLIALGAVPVDMPGNPVRNQSEIQHPLLPENQVQESRQTSYGIDQQTELLILELLQKGTYSLKEIMHILKPALNDAILQHFLEHSPAVHIFSGRPKKYTCRNSPTLTLF